tara:strand:+ start:253 stop:690 length:438 start_codon:yes stop_codon:yes gene_type:complete
MVVSNIFNNLNLFATSERYSFVLGFFNPHNNLSNSIFHSLAVFLLNAVSYLYILIKFYKVLCYSKMTFEWLPMINPYVWPFSVFHVLTGPYFAFWSKILPTIKFERSSVEISGIIALESLNSLIYFCVKATNQLIIILEQLETVT